MLSNGDNAAGPTVVSPRIIAASPCLTRSDRRQIGEWRGLILGPSFWPDARAFYIVRKGTPLWTVFNVFSPLQVFRPVLYCKKARRDAGGRERSVQGCPMSSTPTKTTSRRRTVRDFRGSAIRRSPAQDATKKRRGSTLRARTDTGICTAAGVNSCYPTSSKTAVWKLDRFGRSIADCLNNIKILENQDTLGGY